MEKNDFFKFWFVAAVRGNYTLADKLTKFVLI